MPIEFPASPSHGQVFVNDTTVWEYSSAVPGWSINRKAIVQTTDGLVQGSKFANNSINANNLSPTNFYYSLSTNSTTTSGNSTTLITTPSLPAGQYLIMGNINAELNDNALASYAIYWGDVEISTAYIGNDYASLGDIWHRFVLSNAVGPTVNGVVTLVQACWRQSVEAKATDTNLHIVRIGSNL
jgi:hypothetical protein